MGVWWASNGLFTDNRLTGTIDIGHYHTPSQAACMYSTNTEIPVGIYTYIFNIRLSMIDTKYIVQYKTILCIHI